MILFVYSLFLWIIFDFSNPNFQYIEYFESVPFFNIHFFIGFDGFSIFFLILTTFLINLCVLYSWYNIKKHLKEFFLSLLIIQFFLLITFSILDVFIFYIFFESILIPMFLIIGFWGSRTRKLKAAYQFFFYTLFSSLFMLFAMLLIFFELGTSDFQILNLITFSKNKEMLIWFAFFFSFAVKTPMFPFHIWLPEAHVEAPTIGSVLLAGILLKLGTFGFLRFLISLFVYSSIFFSPFIYMFCILGVIYSSLTTLRQIDLKRIIAYSSISHMSFVIAGIFSFNLIALEGALVVMISHGFISSGLFLCVGILYEKHHTRFLKYYSGLTQMIPLLSFFVLFFSLGNLGFPGTSSFVGEFLTLLGLFQSNFVVAFLISTGTIFSAAFSLWFCNRLIFGPLKTNYLNHFNEMSKKDFAILSPLFISILFLGLYPDFFLDSITISILNLLEKF